MKAFLLAAGLGTRLRPLTATIPKCLVPLHGRPLLDYWFAALAKYGITEVLINLHHLPEQVEAYIRHQRYPLHVVPVYEETLLGSAGTVLANRSWVQDEECFLIAYADNLTNANLRAMIDFHRSAQPLLTMGLFETARPQECGIALLDGENTIIAFEEKPRQPKSSLANAGLYVASPRILRYFPEHYPQDFGFDILPQLLGQMKGYPLQAYFLDIGDPQRLQQAQRDIKELVF